MNQLADPAFWIIAGSYYLMPMGISMLIVTVFGAHTRFDWKLGWAWLASVNILSALTVPNELPMLIGNGASLATVLYLLSRDRRRRDKVKKIIGDKSRQALSAMKREMGRMRPRVLRPAPQGAW